MPFFYSCVILCVAHALFISRSPHIEGFRTPSTTTVDKLSWSYVPTLNVSTVIPGRVNMDFRLFCIKFRLFYNLFPMSNGCQTDVKPFSIHSQSILVPIPSQSTIYKCWILSILFENKYINFRYMYQLQNHTNVWYSNLSNLIKLMKHGSVTLET